jgi:putative ABC transport system substrate-binding protein
MLRIGILNSYLTPGLAAHEMARLTAFKEAFEARGMVEGRNFELDVVSSDHRPTIEGAARQFADDGVDLIHAIGTPNGVAASEATSEIPIVYYGAHPEGIGNQACSSPNVTGQIVALPFTYNYKRFRFLRSFLPNVRIVWSPFFEGTVFIREEMHALHRAVAEREGRRRWLHGESEPVGFASLAGLAYVIGVEYREFLYSDAEELGRALEEVDPSDGVLVPYNESFYCSGALHLILRLCGERRIPLIWNNNPYVVALGGLSGIGVDFEVQGRECGRKAAAILLDGASPSEISRDYVERQIAWVNVDTARKQGLTLSRDVLAAFDRVVSEPFDPVSSEPLEGIGA